MKNKIFMQIIADYMQTYNLLSAKFCLPVLKISD